MTDLTDLHRIRPDAHRRFVADRLLALKSRLRSQVHSASDERSLRLATWNLMHFGNSGAYTRTTESMMYIAEIIDHFDLVAIQEVNENMDALRRLMHGHLGDAWDWIVTDTTEGSRGNRERLAFVYRRSKVRFRKEAGETVLPEGQKIVGPAGSRSAGREVQFARTPFSVAFQAGWFKFKICTVHIYYGKASGAELTHRKREIERIAGFLARRQERERETLGDEANYVLLGDFNIVSPEHETMQALEGAGFEVPAGIRNAASSLSGNHHYDQIAFKLADRRFRALGGGVFDMFAAVYRDADADHYIDVVQPEAFDRDSDGDPRNREQKARYFKRYYRRHQMSDHKLLWVEARIDFSDDYLTAFAQG
jgi:endonuclease/exonuclease/phosphatase family metal-dependent hydrolase